MNLFSKKFRSGFTIVELLVVISVIATLSVVAYASTQVIKTNRYNTKRIADVATLSNAMEAQYMQTKTIPDPTANRQYYDKFGGYEHSASGAYGVTSLFSEDILGKSSLAYHPRDPDTDSYYAYGKLLQYSPEYQIGAVLRVDGTPTAYIRGTYTHTELNSLIRGYNTNTFAIDGGTSSLPYNPYLKEVTAYIIESSGAVTISPNKSLTGPLGVNDTLIVGTGGLAVLKVSDGTELIIGSNTTESKLSLTSLELKDNSGLFTKVRGMLAVGEVVAKAPKLRNIGGTQSELEIQTNNAVAAVRGTIFGVKVPQEGSSTSTFTLIAGSIQMAETTPTATMTITGSGVVDDVITVIEGQTPVTVDVVSHIATSQAIIDPTDPTLVAIRDKINVAMPVESTLVAPINISFVSPTGGATAGVSEGKVVMTSVPGTKSIKVNGISFPVSTGGTDMTLPFAISESGNYTFEYCQDTTGNKCSRPYTINIPNPQAGNVPLESLAPIVENKVEQLAMSETTGDSDTVTITPVLTTNTGSSTTSAGSISNSTATIDYCSDLGVKSSDKTMIACVDYTKGRINLSYTGSNSLITSLFSDPSKGYANNLSSTLGVNIPTLYPSFTKYISTSNVNISKNFALEVGLDGKDLMRAVSGRNYILHGGDDLQLYLENGYIKMHSNLNFTTQNTTTLSTTQKDISAISPLNLDLTKKYILKVDINGYSVSIQARENIVRSSWITVLSGNTSSTSNPIRINTILVGSTLANSITNNSTIGQWGGYIPFFRVWDGD